MKILLVEDDQQMGELLSATLTAHRYAVDWVQDGQSALEMAELWSYDLITLDIGIPKLDGISVCRKLRSRGQTTPVLMLTAQNSSNDVIQGLDAGADDYITKPFDPEQLLARIRALLRRIGDANLTIELKWGDLCLKPNLAQVLYGQQSVALRPKEYSLLELFLRYPQRIFSRNAILDHLWTLDDCPSEHAVTNLIKDLRRQLKAVGMSEELIETVYGLGYRLNPPPQTHPQNQSESEQKQDQKESVKTASRGLEAIAQIKQRFLSSLEERLKLLEDATRSILEDQLQAAQHQAAQEEAHRLAGNLGTFGYLKGSDLMRAAEHLLKDVALGKSQGLQLSQMLLQLRQELALSAPSPIAEVIPVDLPRLWLMATSSPFTEALQQEAGVYGLQLDVFSDWKAVRKLPVEIAPAAILLVLENSKERGDKYAPIAELKKRFPTVPVIVLAEQDSLTDRVQVVRLGADRYFSQTLNPAAVFQEITQQLLRSHPAEGNVMVVDDDPTMLATLSELLQPWGLQVTCLQDPTKFWDVLTATHPDLLLLDVEMPTFNGIELCQVVRQDSQYGNLPILIVTAHTDIESIQRVFAAGADDLIAKPIAGPELVTRVTSRLERSRLRQQVEALRQQQTLAFQQQARTDALTQVANRRAFDEYIQKVWQSSIQAQKPLSLILCDLDCFKHYNDLYGHLAGDVCLKQIANAIQNCLKLTTDQVARYGGEEFIITLPDTPLTDALYIVERFQQAIAMLQIPHEGFAVSPYVTVSMGITGTTPTPSQSIEDLIASADRALYAAKEKGRNTYCLYPL